MAKDPAFPFYAQDFLSGTAFMSMEERGAYITLLCHQWNVGKIPKKRLGFVLGSDWESLWEVIGSKFKTDGNGFVWNERLEVEREKRRLFKEKQRENGLKGGRPKKEDNPEETQTEPKRKPLEEENDNERGIEKVKEWVGKKSEAIEMLCKNNKVTLVAVRDEFDDMCKYYRAHPERPFPKGKPYDVMDYWLNNSKKFKSNGKGKVEADQPLPPSQKVLNRD